MRPALPIAVLVLAAVVSTTAWAEDWPTYRHDVGRTGATDETLRLPLASVWQHRSPHAPRPAWPAPARRDIWNMHENLQPEVAFDRAYQVVAAGGRAFFGSSADDHVYCLSLTDGTVQWCFVTGGPVRLAPAVDGDRVLVASDDGCVYCLTAETGELVWQQRIAPQERWLPGNSRMISAWPVRCGLAVDGGTVYCCAGLFPGEGVYVAALDATTGAARWVENCDSISPQGHMVAAATRLFVPTGRTAPVPFDRATGKQAGGHYGDVGGAFALVTDDTLVAGPGRRAGHVQISDVRSSQNLATFLGLHLVVHDNIAYLHSGRTVRALDRRTWTALARQRTEPEKRKRELDAKLKEAKQTGTPELVAELQDQVEDAADEIATLTEQMQKCFSWEQPCAESLSFILAGDLLLCGGDGIVVAYSARDGARLWEAPVLGRAYCICAADGKLVVSTDRGIVECFAPGGEAQ